MELMNRFCSLTELKEIRVESRISALLILGGEKTKSLSVFYGAVTHEQQEDSGPVNSLPPRPGLWIQARLSRLPLRAPPDVLYLPRAAFRFIFMVFPFCWLTFLNSASSCVIIPMKSLL